MATMAIVNCQLLNGQFTVQAVDCVCDNSNSNSNSNRGLVNSRSQLLPYNTVPGLLFQQCPSEVTEAAGRTVEQSECGFQH